MSRKDNFRKAAFDMFGVGGKGLEDRPEEVPAPQDIPEEPVKTEEMEMNSQMNDLFSDGIRAPEPLTDPVVPAGPKYQTTVLAEGSVFEGTLRAKGSVDLACEFKGDIFAEGDVTMRTSLDGNVEGKRVELISCTVQGDIKAGSLVRVDRGSSVKGNVITRDLTCSGRVEGDITAEGHVTLESDAVLTGNLTAATLSIDEGATIEGNLKVCRPRK